MSKTKAKVGRPPGAASPAPRQRAGGAFAVAERHSRRVRLLKGVLPLLAVVMAGAFAFFTISAVPPGVSIESVSASVSKGELVMANPRLAGFTKDNLPYSMVAKRAIQAIKNEDIVRLEEIDARVPLSKTSWAMIDSDRGIYDRANNTLEITAPVNVTTTEGTSMKLEAAFLDIAKGLLTTDKPVDIQLDGSRIEAQSMTASDKGSQILFENRVKVTIDPQKMSSARDGGNHAVR
jgi:lipopolysaccharide export system protein LptC